MGIFCVYTDIVDQIENWWNWQFFYVCYLVGKWNLSPWCWTFSILDRVVFFEGRFFEDIAMVRQSLHISWQSKVFWNRFDLSEFFSMIMWLLIAFFDYSYLAVIFEKLKAFFNDIVMVHCFLSIHQSSLWYFLNFCYFGHENHTKVWIGGIISFMRSS